MARRALEGSPGTFSGDVGRFSGPSPAAWRFRGDSATSRIQRLRPSYDPGMDPIRPAAPPRARALTRAWALSTAAVAALAALWVVSTQLPAIRAHSPWAIDPYDAVLSVA